MKNLIKILGLLAIFGMFIIQSCEKTDLQPDEQSAEDEARAEYIVGDAFALANGAAGGDNGGGGKLSLDSTDCPVIAITGFFPNRTMTLTFDSCEYKGATRDGVINVEFVRQQDSSQHYASMAISFTEYYIDGINVEGNIVVAVGGNDSVPSFTITQTDIVLTFPDNRTIQRNSVQEFSMEEGFVTPEGDDDVFVINGTSNSVNRDSVSYSSVQADVRYERACGNIPVSGTTTITSDDNITTINFGEGDCDNIIVVTANGITKTITLD